MGILDSALSAFDIFKPTTEQTTFKQADYPGQGLVKLGQDAMKKPPEQMSKQPTIPELNTQMELQKKAPGVARTADQAVLNAPTEAVEAKSGLNFNPDKLMMALSTMKPQKQQQLTSMSSGRTGGGFRAPDSSLYSNPAADRKMQEIANREAKTWNQLIPNLPN